jgi:hypothetical protein
MKRFKEYIQEKTFSIDKDIDYIYNKYFKKRILSIKKGTYNFPTNEKIFGTMNSKELPSKVAQKATNIKPITINIGILNAGNGYRPLDNEMILSLNINATKLFKEFNVNKISDLKDTLGSQYNRFKNEFEESNIKGSIGHELSHWINDTLYNLNITKNVKRVSKELDYETKMDIFKMGEKNVNIAFREIDAQVHAIKQLKKDYKQNWNELGIEDIMTIKPSFNGVFKDVHALGKDDYDKYMKRLLKRLDREKLLGKNMKYIPYYSFYNTITR